MARLVGTKRALLPGFCELACIGRWAGTICLRARVRVTLDLGQVMEHWAGMLTVRKNLQSVLHRSSRLIRAWMTARGQGALGKLLHDRLGLQEEDRSPWVVGFYTVGPVGPCAWLCELCRIPAGFNIDLKHTGMVLAGMVL